jgi:hypothetical protein
VLGKAASWRRRSLAVQPADNRVDAATLDRFLGGLGHDGSRARQLDRDAGQRMEAISALSSLTSPLALDYLERLARPVPALTLPAGVLIVTRSYAAHLVVEADASTYGADDVPVLGTLPPLRRGSPPQDLTVRVVKATRRNFELIRAVSTPVWDGFVWCVTRHVHDLVVRDTELLAIDVVDGLARFGWVLRQVDLHYGLSPEPAA